ncbi:MAG: RNA polymerase sigma factor [Cyclobacteriaceae bacterium]|nr:RNA polymerase sigma factor [Cyclobacteriaceae bacterium HetDA_MAG_MS6]
MKIDKEVSNQEDLELIHKIREGDRDALSKLIDKHYQYIYNISLKFFNNEQDAEDAAQEVTIKLVTSISSFKSERGKFTTWLYRIVLNHFLKAKKSGPEKVVVNGFDTFFGIIDGVDDQPMSASEERDNQELIDEVRVTCMAGMLMCLDREQRMIYILGELFEIDHQMGADIFGITQANFRQRLSRVRKDLYKWMNKKCGLVNTDNPCRCPKKTRGFVERGFVNPDKLKWNTNFRKRISSLSEAEAKNMENEYEKIYADLYKDHPFKETADQSEEILTTIWRNKDFVETFRLDEG